MPQLVNTSNVVTVNFDENTAATHEVVAAVAGKTIVVYEVCLFAAAANDVTFTSAATAIVGPLGMAAGNIFQYDHSELLPLYACVAGEAAQITLSAATRVSGFIKYSQE